MQIYVKQVMPVIYYPDKTCYKNKKIIEFMVFFTQIVWLHAKDVFGLEKTKQNTSFYNYFI